MRITSILRIIHVLILLMHGTIHVILPVGGIVRESAIAVIAIVSASHGFECFFSSNARLTVFVCLDNKTTVLANLVTLKAKEAKR
jgi:hypothetical protein